MEPVAGAAAPLIVRWRRHVAAAALVALAFVQDPGRIVGDTKADLVLDPATLLHRALQAWTGQQGFGQLGNQTYGYLFPMGPFFLIGHGVGLPAWWTQRLWWVLLLLLAYYGTYRLAAALDIGTPGGRIAGALAYAAAPRVLTVLGAISVEAWPGALVPWTLLPLVLARSGPAPDRGARVLDVRRAAALSACAVLAMGAVNAAATLAALAVPAGYLLGGVARPAGRRLLAWWLAATALATAWWLGPLLILGRYGYPFLDYIETARVTTSTTGVLETLRGAEHWGGYLLEAGLPRWPAGFELSYGLFATLCTCLLAAAGLAGLCRQDLPDAGRWRGCAVVGLVLITAGHAATFGGGAAHAVQALLDGSLAAFRNVHKFDPLVRLPLALGVAHAVGRLLAADRHLIAVAPAGARGTAVRGYGRVPARLPAPSAVALAAALLGLAGSLLPGVQDGVAPPGSYTGVPAYWSRLAGWLGDRSSAGSALLLPSSNFAIYRWGSPRDEPLQALARGPWAVRDAVPLGAPGTYRILDGLDALLAEGRPSAQFAPVLARLGVHYVVLRNDLDPLSAGAEQPKVVRAALAGSAGITRVTSFGPSHAVEVFAVAGTVPSVTALPARSALAVSGGPESVVGTAGSIGPGRAFLLLDDARDHAVGGVVVTDTGRRRALAFGYSVAVPRVGVDGEPLDVAPDLARYSPTLPASADPAGGRPAAQFGPQLPLDEQTVSGLDGVRSVTASSSAADPFALYYRGVANRPESALDGDRRTSWISAGPRSVGAWLSVALTAAVQVPAVRVRFVDDRDVGPSVAEVEIRTDAGAVRHAVAKGTGLQRLTLPSGATRTLRITVTGVRGRPAGQVGITDIVIPGLFPLARLTTARAFPSALIGKPTAIRLDRSGGDRAPCVLSTPTATCSTALAHQGEEVVPYARTVRVVGPVGPSTHVSVRAVASTPELRALVAGAVPIKVRASSSAVSAVAASGIAAVDGDRATAWTPEQKDRAPMLGLRFPADLAGHRVTIRGAIPPGTKLIVASAGRRVVLTPKSGHLPGVQLSGRDWTVTVQRKHPDDLVRIAEIEVDDVPTNPNRITVGCGFGPSVTIDGRSTPLTVSATVRQVMSGAVLAATPCTAGRILAAGVHDVRLVDTSSFVVTGLGLGFAQLPTATPRLVGVTSASDTRITARVGAGAAGYLQLSTSANAGWRATLGGRALTGIRLDGWRQGFVLPAGTSTGQLVVTFGPQAAQRLTLAVGAAGAAVLLVFAVLPTRGGRGAASSSAARPRVRGVRRRRLAAPCAAAAAIVVCWLIAGVAGGLIGIAVLMLPRRTWAWLGAAAMVIAGGCAVVAPDSAAASFCAVVAAAALVVSTLCASWINGRRARVREEQPSASHGARDAGSVPRPGASSVRRSRSSRAASTPAR